MLDRVSIVAAGTSEPRGSHCHGGFDNRVVGYGGHYFILLTIAHGSDITIDSTMGMTIFLFDVLPIVFKVGGVFLQWLKRSIYL